MLVLREGAVKQAVVTSTRRRSTGRPSTVAASLNARLADRDSVARKRSCRDAGEPTVEPRRCARRRAHRADDARVRRRHRGGRLLRRLLNVMAAPGVRPEREAAPRLRCAREPGLHRHARRQVASRGEVQVFIGHENDHARCTTCRSSSRRTGGRGRATGVVGVLGPTRMAYPQRDQHRPLRQRADERTGGCTCTPTHGGPPTNDPRRGAHRRARRLAGELATEVADLKAPRGREQEAAENKPAGSERPPTFLNFRGGPSRSASRRSGSPTESLLRKVLVGRRRLRPRHGQSPDGRRRPGWFEGVGHRPEAARLLESEG